MARSAANLSVAHVWHSRFARTALLVVLLVAAVLGAWFLLPLEEWLRSLAGWVRSFGSLAMAVFAGLAVIATLAMAPASTVYLAAGLLFGIGWGLVLAFATALVGALIAFLLARTLLRARIERAIAKRPVFRAIDQAIREFGWRVVLLLRVAPLVPGNVQNYAFGLTDVRLHHFFFATALGAVPWVLLFTTLGSAGAYYLGRADDGLGAWQWALVGAGIAIFALIAWLIGRRARARLAEMGIDMDGERRTPSASGPKPAAGPADAPKAERAPEGETP